MNRISRKIGIALLTAATAFAPLATTAAQAGDRHWNPRIYKRVDDPSRLFNYREYSDRQQQYYDRRIYRRYKHDDAIALGIIGLGVGAIIGGAIANSHQPRVIYRERSHTAGGASYEPWSKSWFRYCSKKYRSFNAATGTYRGYDGRDHFCVVR